VRIGEFAPNVLDVVLVLLFAYVLHRGWRQGAVAQIGAFGGLTLGLLTGLWAAPLVGRVLIDGPGTGAGLLSLGVVLVVMLVGHGLGTGIARRVRPVVHRAGLGALDRALGLGVGGLGLLLVVWLLSSVLAQGPFSGLTQQVRGSHVVQALDGALPPPPDVLGGISAHLADQGFPQVFTDAGRAITAPPVPPAAGAAVQAAAAAGQPSTVQIRARGCGAALGAGSGFVSRPGFVVTNAHVIAGFGQLRVRDTSGEYPATAIHLDPALDIAVLSAPDLHAPEIGWTTTPVTRGTQGATLGFPGGQRQMMVRPATVQARLDAVGRDIYGAGTAHREILALAAQVEQGDSGGPFVTSDGLVGGVVFAGDPGNRANGYALTAEQVHPAVQAAIGRNQEVGVGACRF
jgi:S1-C subfamily serine protease